MGEGAWRSKDGKAMATATCKDGPKSVRLFSSDEQEQGGRNRMVMMVCGDAGASKADRVAALKQARDRLAADSRSAMSGEMRAKVIAEGANLVRLFEDREAPSLDAYFVYPEELRSVTRLQVFRDFLISKAQRWNY